ncbi:MAG: triose-phosphate isomerase [Dehalococcoidia bacterium]|nr:triose-phosphate isomerase [Dehalococcoidia bacterium]
MRELLIAGNWKMNCTIEEAVELAKAVRQGLGSVVGVEVAVCPPFVDLQAVNAVLTGTGIELGAQDVFHEDAGAYTGAISPRMLRGLCKYAIVGHSERRQVFGDTDESIARKVYALVRHEIAPIFCIGETLSEFESSRTAEVLQRQVMAVLNEADPIANLVIAYEPVWAIGTGKSADPETVNMTVAGVRALLARAWGSDIADRIRILYGGSVNSSNVASYIRQTEIDGALVGGASLRAQEFCDIVFATASTQR